MKLGLFFAIVGCTLLVSTALVILETPGASGETFSFSEFLGIYDTVTYEISVDSTDTEVVLSLSEDVPLDIYNPMGNEVHYQSNWSNQRWRASFLPESRGKYSCIIHTTFVAVDLSGECNFPIRDVTVQFSTEVADQQNLTYTIRIKDPNRPIAVHLEWKDTFDRIHCSMKGPDGGTVHYSGDGGMGDSYYIFPARDYGTYKLTIRGSRIESAKTVEFKASCNHALSGPGVGEGDGSDGAPFTSLLAITLLVVVGVLAALMVLRSRRTKEREPGVVTDISEFEQPKVSGGRYKKEDFSYISAPPGRPSSPQARPSSYEDLYGSDQRTAAHHHVPVPVARQQEIEEADWEEEPTTSPETASSSKTLQRAPGAQPSPPAGGFHQQPTRSEWEPATVQETRPSVPSAYPPSIATGPTSGLVVCGRCGGQMPAHYSSCPHCGQPR